jgi:hypothetical protein
MCASLGVVKQELRGNFDRRRCQKLRSIDRPSKTHGPTFRTSAVRIVESSVGTCRRLCADDGALENDPLDLAARDALARTIDVWQGQAHNP